MFCHCLLHSMWKSLALATLIFFPHMLVSLFTNRVSSSFIAIVEMRFILQYAIFPLSAPPHYFFQKEIFVVLRGRYCFTTEEIISSNGFVVNKRKIPHFFVDSSARNISMPKFSL